MSISPYHSPPAVRRWRRLPILLLTLPGMFGLASSALAATLTVTNANDTGPGSLRGAIAAAAAADTVTFDAGAFPTNGSTVINLTGGRIAVNKNLVIQGPGAGSVTISNGSDGIFSVTGSNTASITVQMSGLTLANGNGTSATSNGNGGGVYAFAANLTLTGCVFTGNIASGSGGAISANGGTVSLTRCTLSGNTAGVGGAISTSGSGVTLTGCTLSGNTAGVYGGGLSSSGSSVTVTNCTFSGNAASSGGGIYVPGSSALSLTNCTLVANRANGSQGSSGAGGGIYSGSSGTGVVSVQSSIINGNNAASGGPDVFGSVASGGSNMIGDPNGAAYGFTGPHDLIGVDPKMDPRGLGSNGGPTQTVAILAGSPAIGGDYNNATATDQRGFARTASQHTIGAFEYQPTHTHILWNNTDGKADLWTVDSRGNHADVAYGPFVEGPGSVWSAKALSVGSDNLPHILWNNSDGRVSLWNVAPNGNFVTVGTYGPFTDGAPGNKWTATALASGADGFSYILWNNTDGKADLWTVDSRGNHADVAYGPFVEGPGSVWSATALAVGPDGVPHILWNNTDKRASLWNVNPDGSFVTVGTYGPFVEGPGSVWLATALSVGSDNLPHILWNNSDGRVSLWNVNPDGRFVTVGTYGPFTDGAPGNKWTATAVASGP